LDKTDSRYYVIGNDINYSIRYQYREEFRAIIDIVSLYRKCLDFAMPLFIFEKQFYYERKYTLLDIFFEILLPNTLTDSFAIILDSFNYWRRTINGSNRPISKERALRNCQSRRCNFVVLFGLLFFIRVYNRHFEHFMNEGSKYGYIFTVDIFQNYSNQKESRYS
jgi:hypothetical protein